MDSSYGKGFIIKGYTEDVQQTLHNQIVSITFIMESYS